MTGDVVRDDGGVFGFGLGGAVGFAGDADLDSLSTFVRTSALAQSQPVVAASNKVPHAHTRCAPRIVNRKVAHFRVSRRRLSLCVH